MTGRCALVGSGAAERVAAASDDRFDTSFSSALLAASALGAPPRHCATCTVNVLYCTVLCCTVLYCTVASLLIRGKTRQVSYLSLFACLFPFAFLKERANEAQAAHRPKLGPPAKIHTLTLLIY